MTLLLSDAKNPQGHLILSSGCDGQKRLQTAKFTLLIILKAVLTILLTTLLMTKLTVAGTQAGYTQQDGKAELPSRLVILQYHHVSHRLARSTSLTFNEFYQHLELITQLNAEISDIAGALQRIKQQPNGLFFVAITFDDASTSLLDQAIPELQRRGWPYTLFVNTAAVEQQHRHTMSWQQIRQLKNRGAVIANHSHSHKHLVQQADWQADITYAQQQLKKYIYPNEPIPKLFSYPFGEYNRDIATYLNRHQWLAVGQHSGAVGINSDRVSLPRFPVSGRFAHLKSLRNKLLTLPFPATDNAQAIEHESGIINFTVTLDTPLPSDFNLQQLSCFHSEKGAITAKTSATTITVSELTPFKSRRGKINCTRPHHRFRQHYYWFSQLFINVRCHESHCPVE